MGLTTRKLPNYGSERRHVILDQGVPVGLLSKLPNTRTEEHPWKLFLYVGEFVPGETDTRLVTTMFWRPGSARQIDSCV